MQNMNQISLDMYQTLGMAVAVLFLGAFLKKRIKFLETFCIPSPVVGGLIFAIVSCILYATGILEISFDETLKNVCMVIFFTSVGFQANLKVLKSGGLSLVVFLVCVIVLIISQNLVSVGLAKLVGVSPLIGLSTGSIPMVGGHGTAGAFGPVLEDLGISGASTLCTAAATFGLVAGSLMGGPIGRRLILKHDLLKTAVMEDDATLVEDEKKHKRSVSMYAPATYQIAIAMGLGTIVSWALSKTGILALPLLILLAGQVALMFVFTYFVLFNVMGRNYDAAVLAAGTCGFGMGATPNAMANMQALTEKYVPSVKAYLLVPIIGSMFADFLNSLTITFFINLF